MPQAVKISEKSRALILPLMYLDADDVTHLNGCYFIVDYKVEVPWLVVRETFFWDHFRALEPEKEDAFFAVINKIIYDE